MDATSSPHVIAPLQRQRFRQLRDDGRGSRAGIPECQRSGPSLASSLRFALLLSCAVAYDASAQTRELLESVRLHRPQARTLAEKELEACRRSQCASLRRLSLLAGYLALSDGDSESAAKQIRKAGAPPQLEAFYGYYLGQALFYGGDAAAALVPLEDAVKRAPPSLRPRALARLGEAALKAQNLPRAQSALDEVTPMLDQPELYWQRSRLRQLQNNTAGALDDARVIALRFPTHTYAAQAVALLAAAGPEKAFTFEERLRRAQSFYDAGQHTASLAELAVIDKDKLSRGDSTSARVELLRAQALYASGKTSDGDSALEKALKGQSDVAASASYLRARRAMRADDNERARTLMEEVAEKYPKEYPAQEALYYVGWLQLRAKKFNEAARAFEAYAKRYPRSKKTDEAMWYRALSRLKGNHYGPAKLAFEELAAKFPRSSLLPQARYWAIRSAQLEGAPDTELAGRYEEMVKAFPASFYATLSVARLRAMGKDTGLNIPRWSPPKRPSIPSELGTAEALAQTGLFRDLGDELEVASRTARTPAKALDMALTLDRWGEHGAAYQVAVRRLWAEAFTRLEPSALGLLYPRAYQDAVEEASKRESLDPYFAWSIMRRESAFRPEVMSAADARGLMQLIPPTSTAIAREMNVTAPDPASLFSPDVNIRFATWYLSRLFSRFNHSILVAGAYNAGPPRAAQWSSEMKNSELDLFVEEIPFKETRAYVKQVVADHAIYHAMYADPAKLPLPPMKVPSAGNGIDF